MVTPDEQKKIAPKAVNGRELLPRRRQILELLAEYRYLTTGQLRAVLEDKRDGRRLWDDLDFLRSQKLIRGFDYNRAAGGYSEYLWQLALRGAKELGLADLPSSFYSKPKLLQIRQLDLTLAFEKAIRQSNWEMIKPVAYTNTRPLPDATPQAVRLLQALATCTGRTVSELLEVPLGANDYVVWRDALTAVFILARRDDGKRLWRKRIKRYRLLARYVPVFAVFADGEEGLARRYKPELNRQGIKVTLCGRLATVLTALRETG
jgi:hypothetical protein